LTKLAMDFKYLHQPDQGPLWDEFVPVGKRRLVTGKVKMGLRPHTFPAGFRLLVVAPVNWLAALPGQSTAVRNLLVPVQPDGSLAFEITPVDRREIEPAALSDQFLIQIVPTGEEVGHIPVFRYWPLPPVEPEVKVTAMVESSGSGPNSEDGGVRAYRLSWEAPSAADEVLVEARMAGGTSEWVVVSRYWPNGNRGCTVVEIVYAGISPLLPGAEPLQFRVTPILFYPP
jgi:hypothetical protein